jgi:hypothetical protein
MYPMYANDSKNTPFYTHINSYEAEPNTFLRICTHTQTITISIDLCPPMLFKLRPCIQKLCNVYYPPTPSLGCIRQIKGRSLSLASARSASWLAYSLHPRSLTPIWSWMQRCTKPMPTHAHPWTITSHPCPPKTHGHGWAWAWAPNVGLWYEGPTPNIYNLFSKTFTWSKCVPTIVGPHLGKVHWHCSTGEPQPCEVAMCVVPWCICLLPSLKNVQWIP